MCDSSMLKMPLRWVFSHISGLVAAFFFFGTVKSFFRVKRMFLGILGMFSHTEQLMNYAEVVPKKRETNTLDTMFIKYQSRIFVKSFF